MTVRRIQLSFGLIAFLYWLGTGLPMAILALFYLARGIDLFGIGVCFASYAVTVAVFEIPTGGLADVVGRRRVTIMACLCMAAGTLLVLFSYSLVLFMAGGVLYGWSRALLSGSLEAWFVDACKAVDPQSDIQRGLALANTGTLLGLGLGLLTGGFLPRLFSHLPPESEAVISPLSTTMIASLGVQALVFFTVLGLMKEPPRSGQRSVMKAMGDSVRFTLGSREVMLFLVSAVCVGVLMAVVEAFWQPFFAALLGGFEGKTHRFGILFTLTFAASAAANGLAVVLSKWLNKQYALICIIANGVQLAGLLLLARQSAFLAAAAFFLLLYGGNGLLYSPAAAYLNDRIPSDKRATMISIASLAAACGGAIAYLGGGAMAEHFSITITWKAASGFLPISMLVFFILWRRQVRQTREPELRAV